MDNYIINTIKFTDYMKRLFSLIPFLFLMGCTPNEEDIIFHYSVLKALDNGVLEGNMKVGELKQYGDFGLGTFNKLNGEMIILDHVVYRLSPEGKIMQPDDKMLIPYSVITFYHQNDTLAMSGEINYPALSAFVDRRVPSKNRFYAFRISGEFEYIKCGGARTQERPYNKSLVQMLADRPVYEGENIRGTLVGFWCPSYIGDINTTGFHLHFLSDDHSMGGHLMEFSARSLEIGYDTKSMYKILLPDTEDFSKALFRGESVNYR
ncbi:MAG: alpha-acetolactate decarboxylase [Bacteroidetes bacterium RBG_13_43_22]|nr:MAG: alpha-acetolactate decarboxylase [Bacteroidetes bacterium RBG_13_43_22]